MMSTEDSRAVARRYFAEFHDQRQDAILDQIVGPNLLGPTRAATERLRAAFPDVRIRIIDQVAEGDKVATVWEGSGTHQGEWQSPIGPIAPTGNRVTWTATTTLRITDGTIADVIGTHWDHLGILQQLGAVAAQSPRPGA